MAVSIERSYDRRWAKCKRPFIVSGGELSLDMLDLQIQPDLQRSTKRRSS